jgi:dethiobiotin synthetase
MIVSKNYLGSINHTLLTIETLKQRQIPILGLIFNGEPNFDTESTISEISKLPILGRLAPERDLNQKVFQKYVKQWQSCIHKLLL